MNQSEKPEIDTALVKRLIAEQFPEWAGFSFRPVDSAGTDNAIFRLGEDMAIRLPRVDWAVGQVEKEQQWLPMLAPKLPLAIPEPLAMGMPAEGYPWKWSVYRWLEGENAITGQIDNPHEAAIALARFISSMQRIDPAGGPAPGPHNSGRGVPLAERDLPVRNAIEALTDMLDTETAAYAWEAALHAPVWTGQGVWLHGDFHPGNLLVARGQLSAVIDFGTLGVGDPACDLMVAWTFLTPESRHTFRTELQADDAAWARGRGWALSFGLIAYAYYLNTNPVLAAISRRTIDEVIIEYKYGL
ncbi:aminoglycoside phosphotransferase family protein [Paenibacillus contaminans]|uniref:Phosphotransferase n=1 Tax=Paenibacillus contaminans TaxID=450362 RepID=A0A329MU42_9BACL|nr:aminoglycoside phosphotransferase family protein [Paenibacillus contaminans]RAV23182.1 phosphotransferase [Paenibacillus contaminans]